MGVIDLDARVKKLEAEGTGGAVIDQLEAAVTSLEETVNGNGETDFGLVGDVAALETAFGNLIEDVTSKVTLSEGIALDTGARDRYIKAYKIGNIVILQVEVKCTAGSSAAGTAYHIFDLDASITPPALSAGFGLGSASVKSAVLISPNGYVTTDGGAYLSCGVVWTLTPPATT